MVYWITGRPGSGKTTFAKRLSSVIDAFYGTKQTIILDGDDIRTYFETGFTDDDRRHNLVRAIKFAQIIEVQGITPICAFVSPTIELRNLVRNYVKNFTLIYIPNEGDPLWPGTTYEIPTKDEKPHSPEDILDSYLQKNR